MANLQIQQKFKKKISISQNLISQRKMPLNAFPSNLFYARTFLKIHRTVMKYIHKMEES